MRIAINAMPSSGYGGVTYLRQLLPVLDRRQDEHEWLVYGRSATLQQIRFEARKIIFREMRPAGGVFGRLLWEQAALPAIFRRDGVDLVYTANNTDLFLAPRPRVIAIRYTEPFVYRQFYNSFSKIARCVVLKWLTAMSLRSSDHVICVSDYARRLAMAERSPKRGRTSVIHHGVGDPFRPNSRHPADRPEKFLFTSAKMIGYSNLAALVEAYAICRENGVTAPLLIAGGPHDPRYEAEVRRRIAARGLGPFVNLLGYVGSDEMAGLYASASVFIFGSLLEACPNTLIEALACGAAIVAAPTEPNREIAEDAVLWCKGHSPAEIAEAIQTVYQDADVAARLRSAALARAGMFSWEKTADRLAQTLESVYALNTRRHSVRPVVSRRRLT